MREIGWWSSGRQGGFELQEIHPVGTPFGCGRASERDRIGVD
jgi:hypothetical protein